MTPIERAHAWQQHITDWQVSGVSGSAYCKQQSLVYHQFVYWRLPNKEISTPLKTLVSMSATVNTLYGCPVLTERWLMG